MKSENHIGTTILDVANLHQEVQKLIFPEAGGSIDLEDLQQLLKYDVAGDDDKEHFKMLVERYLKDLHARGKDQNEGNMI